MNLGDSQITHSQVRRIWQIARPRAALYTLSTRVTVKGVSPVLCVLHSVPHTPGTWGSSDMLRVYFPENI